MAGLLAIALILLAASAGEWLPSAAAPPLIAANVSAPHSAAATASSHPSPRGRSAAAGRPVRLVVPSLGVDVPVVLATVSQRVLLPPSDPHEVGWWSGGAVPGAARGGAVITGHTVHTGGGVFNDLDRLRTGDRVVVRTVAGRVRYAVTRVIVYRKASLARHAAAVFDQDRPGRLVLITCDDWNGTVYLSNAVVYAARA
ncbi:MAG: class F sortase [Nocardioidaceae bacterium]